MDKERIIAAGEGAHALARELAAIMLQSGVPPAHWDEVLHRVSELIAPHLSAHEDEPASQEE